MIELIKILLSSTLGTISLLIISLFILSLVIFLIIKCIAKIGVLYKSRILLEEKDEKS